MKFGFQQEQSDHDKLSDMVVAAMETGNAGRAREVLAAHADVFPDEVMRIRAETRRDYGISL